MKKKLTVNKLALGNLKTRKKQYTVMIIGMIFAMVFLSGILFLFSSIMSSWDYLQGVTYGKADAIWTNADEETVNEALGEKYYKEAGYAHIIGYGFTDEIAKGTAVGWLDENGKKLANPILLEGVLPTKENEIAIESAALSSMNIKAEVGEKITLNFRAQNGATAFDEYTEKTYTLVGILKNKRSNITTYDVLGYNKEKRDLVPAAIVADNTKTELGGREALTAYLGERKWSDEYEAFEREKMSSDNMYYIMESRNMGNSEGYDTENTIIFAVIIVAVLAGISCLSVINSFNANLKERKKQIGLLRAVGATKRQIVNIFGREAFIISLIVTPVSVLISYFAVKGIISLLGENFVFVPNFKVLILCAVFSVLCVMIATLVPLVSASRISPMQSIRNIETARKMRKKKIKSKTEFTVSSLISKRAMTFSKLRQIVVSVILAVSIFVSCFVFSWYTHNKGLFNHIDSDYKLRIAMDTGYGYVNYDSVNGGFAENDRQQVLSNRYVSEVTGYKVASANMLVSFMNSDYRKFVSGNYNYNFPNEYYYMESHAERVKFEATIKPEDIEKYYFTKLYESYTNAKEKIGYGEFIGVDVIALDENTFDGFEKFVYDGKIDIERLNSGEEILLVAPKKVGIYFNGSKYGGIEEIKNDEVDNNDCLFKADCDFKAGDEIPVSFLTAASPNETSGIPDEFERKDCETKIGALLDEVPNEAWFSTSKIKIITTVKGLENFVKGRTYKSLDIFLNTECNEEIDGEMQSFLKEMTDNIVGSRFTSEYSFVKEQKTDETRLLIAGAAVALLFFAVCIAIINNTITTSIRESKTKIGTLRAVGATRGELVKIYVKELLSMLMWGVIIGFTTFTVGYFVVPIIAREALDITYNPFGAIAFCLITFAVCTTNLYLKIRAEMKNSIIDNIREL